MDIKTYISSGIIESYALGTASQEEASILECVMKNNAEVMQAIFERLASQQAMDPPSHLKAEIREKLNFNDSEEIVGKIIPLNTKVEASPSSTIPGWMKAASVAVLFGLGYLGYEVNSKNTQLQNIAKNNSELSAKVSNLEEMNLVYKNSKKIMLKGVEKHPDMLAEVYLDESNKVYLDIKNLPAAPTGKQYQLWAIVDGKPVDMGMYDDQSKSKVQSMKSVKAPQAFAITLEKEGGNPTPTMEEMYEMGTI